MRTENLNPNVLTMKIGAFDKPMSKAQILVAVFRSLLARCLNSLKPTFYGVVLELGV